MRTAQCHPHRRYVAHGLCRNCYMKEWHKKTYRRSTNPKPWGKSLPRALQARWAGHRKQTKEELQAKHDEYVRKVWLPKNRERINAERRHKWATDSAYRENRRLRNWENSLLVKYGLSADDLRTMKNRQDHRCAICRGKERLVVDHDHQTKRVRELLCDRCNRLLGVALDDPHRLQQAARYLRSWQPENR